MPSIAAACASRKTISSARSRCSASSRSNRGRNPTRPERARECGGAAHPGTGAFDDGRYYDVLVEYAKADPTDILIRISATNHGPEAATLHLLPTLWFRNTWSWGDDVARPLLRAAAGNIEATHDALGAYWLACEGAPGLLFTENDSNAERLWGGTNQTPYVKDGINDAIVNGRGDAVNPARTGTKAAAHYPLTVEPDATATIMLRLSEQQHSAPFDGAAEVFNARIAEADALYAQLARPDLSEDERRIQRQAFAGLIWTKQYYRFDIDRWLEGDPGEMPPPAGRKSGRNCAWRSLNNFHVISMPDKWEYPWYAAWDLAFHCVAFAHIDLEFAKHQLELMLREWYMHPNGQLPAYEWAFGDVNPPVHAWATLQVFQLDYQKTGTPDFAFLETAFHKLMLNFGWWVNRKDLAGRNVFQGGFLGLDNIGVFDRSATLPTGGYLEQSDGTAWMGMYTLDMLKIALILAGNDPTYQSIAFKFFEHFWHIAYALNNIGGEGISLWDPEDQFYYDVLNLPDGQKIPLRVHSLVGLMPLLAVETLDMGLAELWPELRRLVRAFQQYRQDPRVAMLLEREHEGRTRGMLALVRGERLRPVLARMFDPNEFLSDYGIRSISRYHLEHPYTFDAGGGTLSVRYEPAESSTGMFGGNSNWRGPIWFPINYLLVEALRRFHAFYGDEFTIEYPTGSGVQHTLDEISDDLARRLVSIFTVDAYGRRPVYGATEIFQSDPHWRDLTLFYEYFHGDNGAGIGASHQTGWTALVAALLAERPKTLAEMRQQRLAAAGASG
jgi:hypothetical protein